MLVLYLICLVCGKILIKLSENLAGTQNLLKIMRNSSGPIQGLPPLSQFCTYEMRGNTEISIKLFFGFSNPELRIQ